MISPTELITMIARRRRNSLTEWFLEDETGTPNWSRIVIVLGALAVLVALKWGVKRLRN
jgi:hypothetical protein